MNTQYFAQLEATLATERLDAYRQDGADDIGTRIKTMDVGDWQPEDIDTDEG